MPISDYGLALLRGMGWKEGIAIGKNSSTSATISVPELRPKGLGLGATKVVQSEMPAKKAVDKDGKELILEKGGFAKIIAGAQKGNYCEVINTNFIKKKLQIFLLYNVFICYRCKVLMKKQDES